MGDQGVKNSFVLFFYEVEVFNLGFELKNQNVLFQDSWKRDELVNKHLQPPKELLLYHVDSYAHISLFLYMDIKKALSFLDDI